MNEIIETIERLRSLANTLPEGERPTFRPGASVAAVAAIEHSLTELLPADFRDLLLHCEAIEAADIWNGYWIGGITELTRSISRGDFPSALTTDKGFTPVVPIATDGGGNAFLLSLTDGKVWKWDHETGGAEVVAAGFTDYLQRVLVDWGHYLSGDDKWRYLSG